MARTTRTTRLPLHDVRDALARRPAGPTQETLRGAARLLDRWRPTCLDSDFVCIVVGDLDSPEGPRYCFGLLDYPAGTGPTPGDWPGDVMPGQPPEGPAGIPLVATDLQPDSTPEAIAAAIRGAIEAYQGPLGPRYHASPQGTPKPPQKLDSGAV